jgi:hypothetical protein
MEYIRGVGSTGVIRTLQDRDLIGVVGRAEGLGRPLLYGTTQRFLEHFGFASLDQLPRPEELPVILRDRAPLEEILDEAEAGVAWEANSAMGVREPPQEELPLEEDAGEETPLLDDPPAGEESPEDDQDV